MFKKDKNLIVVSLGIFFAVSVGYLFWSADRPLQEKWWAVHFEEMRGRNLNFILENNSEREDFSYQLWREEQKEEAQNFQCKEKKCLIEVENKSYQGKILIRVFLEEEEKEIYKNL